MVDKFDSTVDTPYLAREPKGLGPGGIEEEDVQVEEVGTTVDLETDGQPNVEIIEDGSAIIGEEESPAQGFNSNLAEILDEGYLGGLASELTERVENDRASRDDWEQAYTKGLDLLGFKYEERTRPFRGAASVNHPVLEHKLLVLLMKNLNKQQNV